MPSQLPQFEDFTVKNSLISGGLVSKEDLFDENGKFKQGHPKIGGKQKGYKHFSSAALKKLDNMMDIEGIGRIEAIEAMTQAMIKKAVNGDVYAYVSLRDTVDGKPKQSSDIELSGNPIAPIVVVYGKKDLLYQQLKKDGVVDSGLE